LRGVTRTSRAKALASLTWPFSALTGSAFSALTSLRLLGFDGFFGFDFLFLRGGILGLAGFPQLFRESLSRFSFLLLP
jgi:hypothetical protein